ncbi:MAG: hypothetical protein EHM32_02525 [Spirochaetales bacterium]|nr:MAG: hypothetical protein EHM32_02525 [Spirochaetales bacterium]
MKPSLRRSRAWLWLPLAAAMTLGCGFTATIIDQSDTKTTVENPRLEQDPHLKVLLGGAVREIPLRDIRMVKIDPAGMVNFDRQQYYSAQVILRDGSVLSEAGSDSTMDRKCFICVQNSLVGQHREARFRIPLSSVQQIKVDK